jgi:uncharacterized membrane protein
MSEIKPLRVLLWLFYPLAIFFGLHLFEPRYVAILLGLLLLLRRRLDGKHLLSGLSRIDLIVLAILLMLTAITALTNSELLLRLYPAAMNFCMLLLFGISLKYPPSTIERFARLSDPELPPNGVRYTRLITQIWCAFFIANGSLAIYTALYSSRDTWLLYNGFIAYLLMGMLFVGEWLFRHHHFAQRPI